jgi:hypothetical protein
MRSRLDHPAAEKPGRGQAHRPRFASRASPRVEFLETRCLMSGSHSGTADHPRTHVIIPGAAVTVHRSVSHDVDHATVRRQLPAHTQTALPAPIDQSPPGEYKDLATSVAVSPGIPGLPNSPYQIVLETKNPHQTLATAQALPRVPYFGVVGSTSTGDPIDLYRLTVAAGVTGFDFALVSNQAATSVPLQLQLFDGSGKSLGGWWVDSQIASPLHADLGGLPAGSSVYLGITAGSSGAQWGPASSTDYQLWVSLRGSADAAAAAPIAGTIVPTSALMPLVASSVTASTSLAGQASRGASQGALAQPAASSETSALRVAVGSPAVRLARPTSGLLSDGEAAPPAARDFIASANKVWDEPSVAARVPHSSADVNSTALVEVEYVPDALVVMPGPSGFPLVGAVAIGHRRHDPTTFLGDFADRRANEGSSGETAAGPLAQEVLENHDRSATRGENPVQAQVLAARDWVELPVPVFSGLGLATVFTLNAILSQPIGGFDYLTSRLDAVGRPVMDRTNRRRRTPAARHRS